MQEANVREGRNAGYAQLRRLVESYVAHDLTIGIRPGVELRANIYSIFRECDLIQVAF